MKTLRMCPEGGHVRLALALLILGGGCSNLERTREVSNPATAPKTLAQQVCSNCHGVTGVSTSPTFPRLAGQQPEYLVRQLKAFRARSRSDRAGQELMWGLVRGLTDDQITGLADYFAAQTPEAGAPTDPALHGAGRAIFEGGLPERKVPACKTCHGEDAQGKEHYPRLEGQHADYLVKQLEVFKGSDDRPAATEMKEVAKGLDHDQMLAVASYLQAFPAK